MRPAEPFRRHARLGLFAWALVAANATAAGAAEWQLSLITLSQPAQRLELDDDRQRLASVVIQSADGSWEILSSCGDDTCSVPLSHGRRAVKPPRDTAPGTLPTVGDGEIQLAYFAEPTERLATPQFGAQLATGVLVAIDRLKAVHRLDTGLDRAFVMPAPWIRDLDGDKADEILAVEALVGGGQRLVVIGLDGTGLARLAEGATSGDPTRIIDPVAVADFDGDGALEIAVTVGQDGGERLEFWRYRNRSLRQVISLKGFASRRPQSDSVGIGIAADFDGDSVADLLALASDRRSLRLVTLRKAAAAEPMRLQLGSEVVTNLLAIQPSRSVAPTVVFGLADGHLAILKQVEAVDPNAEKSLLDPN